MANSVIQPVKPVATVNAGGVWESINGGLSSALDIWGRVEQIKGQKSASGQDQIDAMYKPELANAAAIQVDKQLTLKNNDSNSIKINKPLFYGSLAIFGLAILLKAKF